MAGDGTTAKHRAKIQLRSNRSFRRSRLPTKFAIYDPGKPKRTSFHDVAGRYLPRQRYDRTSDARVVRRNDEGIGRDARFVTKLRDAADTYTRTYMCECMRIRTRDCQNEFSTLDIRRRNFERVSRFPPSSAVSGKPVSAGADRSSGLDEL